MDSGAECCVCPRDHDQRCPIEPQREHQVPRLVAVRGYPGKVYGYKYVEYTLTQVRLMVVR